MSPQKAITTAFAAAAFPQRGLALTHQPLPSPRRPVSTSPSIRTTRRCAAARAAAEALPLQPGSRAGRGVRAVSHAQILQQCADSLRDIVSAAMESDPHAAESLRLTLDFPPEQSETRAGTLVSRYENNLNFMEKLLRSVGVAPETAEKVGGAVEICDNINPQGGGEYLTDDECMVGLRVQSCPGLEGRPLLVLLNAGVDASTLGDVRGFDTDEGGVVVLLNCGLDRLSWFAKLQFRKYIDQYRVAYYLKNVAGNGWLLKRSLAPWRVFAEGKDGVQLVSEAAERPTLVDVEAQVRLALAGISPKI